MTSEYDRKCETCVSELVADERGKRNEMTELVEIRILLEKLVNYLVPEPSWPDTHDPSMSDEKSQEN